MVVGRLAIAQPCAPLTPVLGVGNRYCFVSLKRPATNAKIRQVALKYCVRIEGRPVKYSPFTLLNNGLGCI
jgi:hypothetical protein